MDLLTLLLPLVIIELGIRIYTIYYIMKLHKQDARFRFDSHVLWAIIVGLVNFGWVAFFIFGVVDDE
jgi:hypothetical protein